MTPNNQVVDLHVGSWLPAIVGALRFVTTVLGACYIFRSQFRSNGVHLMSFTGVVCIRLHCVSSLFVDVLMYTRCSYTIKPPKAATN